MKRIKKTMKRIKKRMKQMKQMKQMKWMQWMKWMKLIRDDEENVLFKIIFLQQVSDFHIWWLNSWRWCSSDDAVSKDTSGN